MHQGHFTKKTLMRTKGQHQLVVIHFDILPTLKRPGFLRCNA